MSDDARVAVLIDCDNISWRLASAIFAETARHGTLSIKRGYGDWTSGFLSGWRPTLPRYGIQPIQQFAHVFGKNASDSALIIDAMDLLYSGNMDAFCIVSSDSDFTRLAMRLRESGKSVYGIGGVKTPEAFTKACDRFTYLEVLVGGPLSEVNGSGEADEPSAGASSAVAGPARETPNDQLVDTRSTPSQPTSSPSDSTPSFPDIKEMLEPAIRATAKESGWSPLSTVGWYLVNNNPSFDSRNYGYAKLGALVRDLDWVETNEMPDASGYGHLWIRVVEGSQ
jgi:hypothetical protein